MCVSQIRNHLTGVGLAMHICPYREGAPKERVSKDEGGPQMRGFRVSLSFETPAPRAHRMKKPECRLPY